MANAQRGHVQVCDDGKGNLAFQIPLIYAQHYYQRNQKYISYGAKDTPANRRDAMTAAIEMQLDMENNKFDPKNVSKYKRLSTELGTYTKPNDASVIDLFTRFCENLIIEETTRRSAYRAFTNHINRLSDNTTLTLMQQKEIYAWLRENMAEGTVLKMLALFNRMIIWGKRESILSEDLANKFSQYRKDFMKSLQGKPAKRVLPKSTAHLPVKEGIQAHTEACRDIIIAAFHNRKGRKNTVKHDHIAYLVEFLFLIGCRHGEAFALTWKDIEYGVDKNDLPQVKININKSYAGSIRAVKSTKTRKDRKVPATDRVIEILEILKPENADLSSLVFRNRNGRHFQSGCMTAHWNPAGITNAKTPNTMATLIAEGKLNYYMDAYSTRRTFVSLQLNKGVPVNTVAMWVGDNPETILKHYARPDDDAVPY